MKIISTKDCIRYRIKQHKKLTTEKEREISFDLLCSLSAKGISERSYVPPRDYFGKRC